MLNVVVVFIVVDDGVTVFNDDEDDVDNVEIELVANLVGINPSTEVLLLVENVFAPPIFLNSLAAEIVEMLFTPFVVHAARIDSGICRWRCAC